MCAWPGSMTFKKRTPLDARNVSVSPLPISVRAPPGDEKRYYL